jgi:hypothetical protein
MSSTLIKQRRPDHTWGYSDENAEHSPCGLRDGVADELCCNADRSLPFGPAAAKESPGADSIYFGGLVQIPDGE